MGLGRAVAGVGTPTEAWGETYEAKTMNPNGRKFCHVTLDPEERLSLQEIVEGGTGSRETRGRAHILLLADINRDGGGRRDSDIANVLGVGTATVERVRRRCVLEGVEAALRRRMRTNRRKRLPDGDGEATLTTLACPEPPDGRAAWTLTLLGERLVALSIVETISTETIRRTSEKRSQALAGCLLMHSTQGQRRFRACDGGCSGDLQPGP